MANNFHYKANRRQWAIAEQKAFHKRFPHLKVSEVKIRYGGVYTTFNTAIEVTLRDDGLAIDWISADPVWSNTLLPPGDTFELVSDKSEATLLKEDLDPLDLIPRKQEAPSHSQESSLHIIRTNMCSTTALSSIPHSASVTEGNDDSSSSLSRLQRSGTLAIPEPVADVNVLSTEEAEQLHTDALDFITKLATYLSFLQR
jgi:hypothetical protein